MKTEVKREKILDQSAINYLDAIAIWEILSKNILIFISIFDESRCIKMKEKFVYMQAFKE